MNKCNKKRNDSVFDQDRAQIRIVLLDTYFNIIDF